jgi:hypothetical protein
MMRCNKVVSGQSEWQMSRDVEKNFGPAGPGKCHEKSRDLYAQGNAMLGWCSWVGRWRIKMSDAMWNVWFREGDFGFRILVLRHWDWPVGGFSIQERSQTSPKRNVNRVIWQPLRLNAALLDFRRKNQRQRNELSSFPGYGLVLPGSLPGWTKP